MSEIDYDDPYVQRALGGKSAEARHWDGLWRDLCKKQRPWEQRPAGRKHFIKSMKRLSSVLAQDKRFWKLSAKHAVVRLWQRVDEDRLLSLEEDEEFDEKFPNTQLSDTYINGMDWQFFSQLILHSFLSALAELHGVTAEGLSRFNELKRQAGQVSGIVTYAHFIDRLDEMIWEDELVERVTAKSFVDAMIAVAEGRASGLSPPDPEPDWRPIESEVRISILRGNASVIPPLTFD